eukprot:scaffold9226_cov37-Tisochrysis_lutea.AAC.2
MRTHHTHAPSTRQGTHRTFSCLAPKARSRYARVTVVGRPAPHVDAKGTAHIAGENVSSVPGGMY